MWLRRVMTTVLEHAPLIWMRTRLWVCNPDMDAIMFVGMSEEDILKDSICLTYQGAPSYLGRHFTPSHAHTYTHKPSQRKILKL